MKQHTGYGHVIVDVNIWFVQSHIRWSGVVIFGASIIRRERGTFFSWLHHRMLPQSISIMDSWILRNNVQVR
jgi:hypothetical protein